MTHDWKRNIAPCSKLTSGWNFSTLEDPLVPQAFDSRTDLYENARRSQLIKFNKQGPGCGIVQNFKFTILCRKKFALRRNALTTCLHSTEPSFAGRFKRQCKLAACTLLVRMPRGELLK